MPSDRLGPRCGDRSRTTERALERRRSFMVNPGSPVRHGPLSVTIMVGLESTRATACQARAPRTACTASSVRRQARWGCLAGGCGALVQVRADIARHGAQVICEFAQRGQTALLSKGGAGLGQNTEAFADDRPGGLTVG